MSGSDDDMQLNGGVELDLADADKSDSDFSDDENALFDDSILPGTPISGIWKPHYPLYVHVTASSLTDRFCEFAILYCLSLAFKNSLVVVAVFCLISKIFRLIFTPQMHGLIGKFSRFNLLALATAIRTVSLAASVVLTLLIYNIYTGDNIPWIDAGFVVMFVFLLLIGTISELSDLVCVLSVNTDWVQVIANSKQYLSTPTTSEINSVRIRASLICKIIAPLLWGGLYSITSITVSLVGLALWTILSGVVEILLLRYLKEKYPDLVSGRIALPGHSGERIDDNQPLLSMEPIQMYTSQHAFLASISYCCIFMCALVPGALVINYLVYRKGSVLEIAALLGIASGVEKIGSLISPRLIELVGLSKCALVSVWVYIFILLIGFIQVVVPIISIWLLIVPLIVSRIFMCTFDLAEKQIVKESADEQNLTKFLAIEYQLSNLSCFLGFAFAIFSNTPNNFVFVAGGTLAAVFIGACLFTLWYRKYGHGHQLSTLPEILD